jgi:hypothetical protein
MLELSQVISSYSKYATSSANCKNEFTVLTNFLKQTVLEDSPWNALPAHKKQIKRILSLKGVKKTLLLENADFFRYEESIIDLYEAITSVLIVVETQLKSNKDVELLNRVYLMLTFLAIKINAFQDMRRIDDLHLTEFKQLINDCLNSDLEEFFIYQSGLLFFESKIEIADRMIKTAGN